MNILGWIISVVFLVLVFGVIGISMYLDYGAEFDG